MSIEQLSFDPSSIVVNGDVLPAANAVDMDAIETTQSGFDEALAEADARKQDYDAARRLIARIEDQAQKSETYAGEGVDSAEHTACMRLGVPYAEYEDAMLLVAQYEANEREKQANTQISPAQLAIEAVRRARRADMTAAEIAEDEARVRARNSKNPQVG